MMPTFDHQRGDALLIDGARIYFETVGDEDAPPFVLLHGGMGNLEDFDALAAQLHERRLIAIDSRGHGKSTPGDKPLTYEQLAHDVRSVVKHLALARYSVLGFSDGGIVGYRLAIDDSEHIDTLIAIGAPNTLPAQTAAILEKVTAASWDEKFPETKIAYERHNPEPDFDSFVQASKRMWLDRSDRGYPMQRVTAIACPTLLIRGDDDHLFSLSEAVGLRQQIKNSHLLNVPCAGHMAFVDQQDLTCLAVKQFLG